MSQSKIETLQAQNDSLTRELQELREKYRETDAKLMAARSLVFDLIDRIDEESEVLDLALDHDA